MVEIELLKEDLQRLKDKYHRLNRDKENIDSLYQQKQRSLQEKIEDLSSYGDDRL